MDRDNLKEEHLVPFFRFAWALAGDEIAAADLVRRVLADPSCPSHSPGAGQTALVALFSHAFRLFTAGKFLEVPPAHDRVAILGKLSLAQASALTADSLLRSFRGLELPQRAALVLFYTTTCSIREIAVVLDRGVEATVGLVARGKAEWLHILQQEEALGGGPPEESNR